MVTICLIIVCAMLAAVCLIIVCAMLAAVVAAAARTPRTRTRRARHRQ
jgi:hypothetical protein